MALYDDLAKGLGEYGGGVAAGVGALLLAPLVLPVLGGMIRPVSKSMLRTGIVLYRQMGEAASEIVAEARAELDGRGPAAGSASSKTASQPHRRKREHERAAGA